LFTGQVATYVLNGFVVSFPANKSQAALLLNDLQVNKWIDEFTRAVIVDLIIYNGNINLFNQVRLVGCLVGFYAVFGFWPFFLIQDYLLSLQASVV
jgi:hypothetical protein